MTRSVLAHVGLYGNTPRDVEIHVYIDSDGRVIKANIEKSSGVDGLDMTALSDVRSSTFAPATFLCTPVVSDFIFSYHYQSS
jgi:TonB family protein